MTNITWYSKNSISGWSILYYKRLTLTNFQPLIRLYILEDAKLFWREIGRFEKNDKKFCGLRLRGKYKLFVYNLI